jgi:dynein heavy chain
MLMEVLAKKVTALYKLAQEQLSKQDHYDFGLRALKAVLVMVGTLKRGSPYVPENVMLVRAVRYVWPMEGAIYLSIMLVRLVDLN